VHLCCITLWGIQAQLVLNTQNMKEMKRSKKKTRQKEGLISIIRGPFLISLFIFLSSVIFLFINGRHTQRTMTIVVKVAIATTP